MIQFRSLLAMPPFLARAVRVAVSLAVLTTVALTVGSDEMLARLTEANPALLAAAFLALNLQTLLCAVRWRLTAARVGQRIGIRDAVTEYYLAQLINQVVPGGVVGDVGRATRARHSGGLILASQAVALERLSGQLALGAIGLMGIAVTAMVPGGLRWPPVVGFSLLAIPLGLLLLRVLSRSRSLQRRMPRFISKVGRLAWRALAAPDVRSRQIALSFGTAACNIAAFALCAWATGTHMSLGAATALVPLMLIAMLIPVGIAGWGFRESAAAALLPMIGATAGAGVAASVAFGGMLLAASMPGLLPILVGESRQSRAERAGHSYAPMPLPIQRRPRDLAAAGRRSMTSVAGTATRDWRAPP
jgi:uncharacterized membrane protein YbhN (UPF0104 family)